MIKPVIKILRRETEENWGQFERYASPLQKKYVHEIIWTELERSLKEEKHSTQGWELIGIDAPIVHVSGTN